MPGQRDRSRRPAAPLPLLAALSCLAISSPAAALDPTRRIDEYILDFWQEDSGLPQNHVYVIYQTRDGYLWMGTRGGLARFDGVRFTVFDDRHPNQLPESEVTALSEGPDGSLWIGTHGGGVSRLKDGTFTTVDAEQGLPEDVVNTVAAAPDGGVWIGTTRGLAHLKDGRITTYTTKHGLADNYVRSVYIDGKGVVWIGSDKGLTSLAGGAFTVHTPVDADVRTLREIIDDGDGGLWLAAHGGLMHYKDGGLTTVASPGGSIQGVCRDPNGTVWFATADAVFRFHGGTVDRLSAEVTSVGADHTLRVSALRTVQAIFADREGSVWLGMMKHGIARVRDAVFTTVAPPQEGPGEESVASVFSDSRGVVWMALKTGVARVENGAVERLPLPGRNITVDTFFEDGAGAVWAADRDVLLRFQSGRFQEVAVDDLNGIIVSFVDRRGNVWLGSRSQGIFLFKDGQVTRYGKSQGMAGTQVRALADDSRGGLWIGTKDGGVSYMREGVVTNYSKKEGLPSLAVSAVYVDREDTVWVATRRGLARLRDGRIARYTAQHGLPVNYFYQIVEDDLGYLWLTHGRGILRVARKELNDVADGRAAALAGRTFGTESGIRSTAMAVPGQPAAHKTRDGRLWFATGNGAAVVNPRALVYNHAPPPVWIESVRVDQETRAGRADAVFPPGNGDVEIRYTGLSFVAPQSVRFKYKLDGFDHDWIDADTRRVAFYTNLPPGAYEFQVRACNNDGVWNDTGHRLRFRLQPHWYQMRWFHAALVALGVVGLVAVPRSRERSHKRRAQELAQRVEEAVGQVKTLRGMLPICASCKKIRDDSGYWNQMETYIEQHSQADFSHGICPDCVNALYPEYAAKVVPAAGSSK